MMEKTIESDLLFQGHIINLRVDTVELDQGEISKREIVEHRGAVVILPVLGDSILFVKQYRKAVEEEVVELPAGTREVGEDIEKTAFRELLEETGYEAKDLEHLSSFYTTPGYSTEEIHLFLATNLTEARGKGKGQDTDENIQAMAITKERAKESLIKGVFKDAKTIAGLSLYFLKEREGA